LRWKVIVPYLGYLAFGIFTWTCRSGLQAVDSVAYLDLAANIAAGHGFVHRWAYWDPVYETGGLPTSTTLWPPGYALALAVPGTLKADLYLGGRLLAFLSFALLPIPLCNLSRSLLHREERLFPTVVATMLAPVMVWASAIVTETPFALLSSLVAFCTVKADAHLGSSRGWWAAAGTLAGLAFLFRYAGIATIASVLVVAMLGGKGGARERALNMLACLPAVVAVALVLTRNLLTWGSLGHPYAHGVWGWPFTEVPFLLMVAVTLVCGYRAFRASGKKSAAIWWLAAGGAAVVATLLRQLGLVCFWAIVAVAITTWKPASPAAARNPLRATILPFGAAVIFVGGLVASMALWPNRDARVFWPALRDTLQAATTSLIGSRTILGRGLAYVLQPLQLLLLASLVALAATSFVKAFRNRGPDRPLEALRVSGILALFTLAYLVPLAALTLPYGARLQPRFLAMCAPWFFLLTAGWALRAGITGSEPRRPSRLALCIGTVWVACQLVVAVLFITRDEESYIATGRDNPAIRFVLTNAARDETILSNRGADIAYWTPNPVLQLPRAPWSARKITTLEEVDQLARMAGARYLLHVRGFPAKEKMRPSEYSFLRSLDEPERFPERRPIVLGDTIVYHVGRAASSISVDDPGSAD
jgi:hypothetical protein